MPPFDDVLAEAFDLSSDTFPDDYANYQGGYANAPALFQQAQPATGAGRDALLGAHRPQPVPDDYANAPGGNPGAPPPGAPANARMPQGYNQKIPAAPGLTGRVHARGNEYTLSMDEHYKDEKGKPDPRTQRVVKYVEDVWQRWEKYGVKVSNPMTRRGTVFDTAAVKAHFFDKNDGAMAGSVFGKSKRTGLDFPWPQEWASKGMIWVCMRHPVTGRAQFYSHVSKRRVNAGVKGYNFSHSSLSAGGEVIAAGEWIVESGKLTRLSANSGHYQPTLTFLHQAAQHLKSAIDGGTSVYVYDHVDDTWVDYPALQFLVSPSGNGRYWAHPRTEA